MRSVLLLCLTVTSAGADTLMTPEEFEAWSTGRTLDYWIDGAYWGAEMHLPGRLTLDADADGLCRKGRWYPEGDMICFTYEISPGPHCWRFRRRGASVQAELAGAPDSLVTEVTLAETPLSCQGPEVGV